MEARIWSLKRSRRGPTVMKGSDERPVSVMSRSAKRLMSVTSASVARNRKDAIGNRMGAIEPKPR